jgi:hypothetical protein
MQIKLTVLNACKLTTQHGVFYKTWRVLAWFGREGVVYIRRRLIDDSLDSAAAIGSDVQARIVWQQTSPPASLSHTSSKNKDSYGVCGGDHDGFGDEASNLPLPLNLLVSKKKSFCLNLPYTHRNIFSIMLLSTHERVLIKKYGLYLQFSFKFIMEMNSNQDN